MLEALQNNTRLSLDQSLRFIVFVPMQLFRYLPRRLKSGTSDASAVIGTLKEVEMQDSAIGEFSFSESGDILGAGDALYQVRPTPTGLRFVPAY